ncbi:RNA polymerase I-specific transcription initiation factor-domain-containing protein [Diplogelasinospora grovesii]|uniref:RNA polymerase I-specific transcription initiation factor-domain-containing protein n=1 Tax=Diplogelasinospora grovesii TaxID=303347 RepID=A0AAN6S3R6_9PEZI|nr:RNA polymerase I-specific transcription initiation factor-domain-containing protein [Diplogelasinospora grovesii]
MEEKEEEQEWDRDTASIASADSEELRATRPNRWSGPASTWRRWTERERNLYRGLIEGQRARDLSLHLYNAFALKKRKPQPIAASAGDADDEDDEYRPGGGGGGHGDEWKEDAVWNGPGRQWTAWPMRADEVPDDDFLRGARVDDDDDDDDDSEDGFTFRMQTGGDGNRNLEEEISANMLRFAKERLRKRVARRKERLLQAQQAQQAEAQQQGKQRQVEQEQEQEQDAVVQSVEVEMGDYPGAAVHTEGTEIAAGSNPGGGGGVGSRTGTPHRQRSISGPPSRSRSPSPSYTPVPSADDDLSYQLLRPISRRILAKLDDTLTVLHNSRQVGLYHMSESSAGEETEPETPQQQQTKKKGRGRPRKPSPSPSSGRPRSTRRGRPKKVHIPLEGETEQEMLVRIAREKKTRLPSFAVDQSRSGAGTETGTEFETEVETEPAGKRRRSRSSRRRRSRSRSSSLASQPRTSDRLREQRLGRWGLRDWRDVLGAAALAGFSEAAIARTAQRCATLFGQDMTMHTLSEHPAIITSMTRYTPAGQQLPVSDSDDDDDDDDDEEDDDNEDMLEEQDRRLVRQSSVFFSTDAYDTEGGGYTTSGRSRAGTPAPRRRSSTPGSHQRGRSTTPGTPSGPHYCPHAGCPRSTTQQQPFDRRRNLIRHIKNMHKDSLEADLATEPEPEPGPESESEPPAAEMDGGVHVDGFLQTIRVKRGWRGGDKSDVGRKRRAGYKTKRSRTLSSQSSME